MTPSDLDLEVSFPSWSWGDRPAGSRKFHKYEIPTLWAIHKLKAKPRRVPPHLSPPSPRSASLCGSHTAPGGRTGEAMKAEPARGISVLHFLMRY